MNPRYILFALLVASAPVKADCIDLVDVSEVSGIDSAGLAAAVCNASVMSIVLDSATIQDTYHGSGGEDLFVAHAGEIEAGTATMETLAAGSAKLIDIEFRAGGISALSFSKLREKIEQYMAETYLALFEQPVALRRVRIAALYPLESGELGVVYGTLIWNAEGLYGPGSSPVSWEVWLLNPSLQQ